MRPRYPYSVPFVAGDKPKRGELTRAVFAHEHAKNVDAQVDALVPSTRLPVRREPLPASGVIERLSVRREPLPASGVIEPLPVRREPLRVTTATRADLERLEAALGAQLDLEGIE